jgi:flagellar motor switch protein FliN/FliY
MARDILSKDEVEALLGGIGDGAGLPAAASEAGAAVAERGTSEAGDDVALEVAVEIGRTTLTLRELLQLGPGAVVELAKVASEHLDVLVDGKPFARGLAVTVNDKFGVRLTDVMSRPR